MNIHESMFILSFLIIIGISIIKILNILNIGKLYNIKFVFIYFISFLFAYGINLIIVIDEYTKNIFRYLFGFSSLLLIFNVMMLSVEIILMFKNFEQRKNIEARNSMNLQNARY